MAFRTLYRLVGLAALGTSAFGCSEESASSPPGASPGGNSTGGSANAGGALGSSGAGGAGATGGGSGGTSGGTGGNGAGGGAGGTGDCAGKGVNTTSYSHTDNVAASQSPPGGLAIANTPMFVTIGFDDNSYSGLSGSTGEGGLSWATQMISARKHANGSPIKMTFYFTSTYVGTWMSESPTYVKRSWRAALDAGNEGGNHTNSHPHGEPFTRVEWDTEIQTCNDWLSKAFDPSEPNTSPSASAGVGLAAEKIYGFRTPFLEYSDETFASVRANGFWYDASIEEGWQSEQNGTNYNWPYTLDRGSPGHEVLVGWGSKKPITTHPGLWEMPVYPLFAPPDSVAAQYGIQPGLRAKLKTIATWYDEQDGRITGFDYNLWVSFKLTAAEFLATLKYSFDLRLKGNRAPFMLGAHTDYYSSKYTAVPNATLAERQKAIEDFIDYALSKPEVRVTSIKEILDWVRDPKPLSCL